MQARPISFDGLTALLVNLIDQQTTERVRVAVDGAPPADPGTLAASVIDPLKARGRFALVIKTDDFWLPASQRFELGRTSPESFYYNWIDVGALHREALGPVADGGSGQVLPKRWNASIDRASRAGYVEIPPRGVVIVAGQMLLGGPLTFDVSVHLAMSDAALARRLAPEWQWTLPAYRQYRDEVAPQDWADVVVRMDDPRRPALARPRPAG